MSVLPELASAEVSPSLLRRLPAWSNSPTLSAELQHLHSRRPTIGSYDWTRIDMINVDGSPVDVTLPLGADGASFA